ncbi:MAG: hypothetical protein Q7K03_05430 [Dehalococcoidia bacterium]|nr:hypothetical protein [Dehalococcoidia bacterium]
MKALQCAVLLLALSLFGASLVQGRTMALLTDSVPVAGNTVTTSAAFVRVAKGSFTKVTAGAPASQAITGVGFQPKAVIFFWTRQTAAGFAAMQSTGFGFATGAANERGVAIAEDDAALTSNAGSWKSATNMILMLSNGTPTLAAKAELTSFDADGFTINWTTNEARADTIHYIALGGDGLTNAVASTFNLSITTGNQAVTGLGFQPDFVLFLFGGTAAGANDTGLLFSQLSLGIAQSSTSQGAVVVATRDADTANTSKRSQQRTNASILLLTNAAPPAQDAIAAFVSMDVDGFTVNKSNAPAASTPIFYLALKGGSHLVGNFAQPAATGSQTVTGVGFQPRSLMFLSRNMVAGTTIVAPNTLSVGAGISSAAQGSIWSQARNVDPSDTNSYTATNAVVTMATGPTTLNAQATLSGFTSDGFTLNWSAADATARQVLYWALR